MKKNKTHHRPGKYYRLNGSRYLCLSWSKKRPGLYVRVDDLGNRLSHAQMAWGEIQDQMQPEQ